MKTVLMLLSFLSTGIVWPDIVPASPENSGRSCIALAVFAEARGEQFAGQVMVAQVIKNRMRQARWPSDPCAVVMQQDQFHGVRDWPTPREPWRKNADAWRWALLATDFAMDYEIDHPCSSADHFWLVGTPAPSGKDAAFTELCRIGNHKFMRHV